MAKATSETEEEFAAMVQIFCVCGTFSTTLSDRTVVCSNSACKRYGVRYRILIELEPIQSKEYRA